MLVFITITAFNFTPNEILQSHQQTPKHFRNSDKLKLQPGMIFTIEPMLTENKADNILWKDGWTVAAKDGGWAAQFEDTVLITDTGVEILTLPS